MKESNLSIGCFAGILMVILSLHALITSVWPALAGGTP